MAPKRYLGDQVMRWAIKLFIVAVIAYLVLILLVIGLFRTYFNYHTGFVAGMLNVVYILWAISLIAIPVSIIVNIVQGKYDKKR